jgi:peptide/nickel transport system substrate-binding protein
VKQKAIAEAVQVRNTQVTTYIPLGQFYQPVAVRKGIDGIPTAPVPVFWNVSKK